MMRRTDSSRAVLATLLLAVSSEVANGQLWNSRRVVDVASARAGGEVDFPVFLELFSDFDYGNAQAGGEDVRVATDEGGQFCVPLWLEKWNSAGSSFVWVAPPEVRTVDIYHGAIPYVALQAIGLALTVAFPFLVFGPLHFFRN